MTMTKRRTTFKRFFLCLLFAVLISAALAFGVRWGIGRIGGNSIIRLEEYYLYAAISAAVIFLFTVHPANRPMRFFKNIGRLILLVVLVALVWAYAGFWTGQNAFIYPEVGVNQQAEEKLKALPQAEQVTVPGEGGASYHGWLVKNGTDKAGLILYFGGNGEESAGKAEAMAQMFSQNQLTGYHFMTLDYPGTGNSAGERGETSEYQMAQAAWQFAASRPEVNPEKIVLVAWSLGTGTATHLASEKNPAGLILLTPYYNGGELVKSFMKQQFLLSIPFPLPIRNPYRSDSHARNIQAPTLVVGVRDDHLVPYEQSEKLAALFPQAKLVTVETGGHEAVWSDQTSLLAMQQFLAGLLAPAAP